MTMLVPPTEGAEIPAQVAIARLIDWGVSIDAFLVDAARVGTRFAASVYLDRSGASVNGMTIATPPVYPVMAVHSSGALYVESQSGHPATPG